MWSLTSVRLSLIEPNWFEDDFLVGGSRLATTFEGGRGLVYDIFSSSSLMTPFQ